MAKKNGYGVHALFKSVGDDGTTWLFLIETAGKWAITREGKHVEGGAADRAGIGTGVEKFLVLTGAANRMREVARA